MSAAVVIPVTRTQEEQVLVYNAAKEASTFIKDVKEGKAQINVPTSNQDIATNVDNRKKNIEAFQNSERAKDLGEKPNQVLEDIKRVLDDQKLILEAKNDDEQAQKAAKSGFVVAKDIAQNPAVRDLLLRWKSELITYAKSGNWKQLLKMGGDVFTKMREAEAFIELIVELSALAKLLANKESKDEREKIFVQMRHTLRVLSANDLWVRVIARREMPDNLATEAMNTVQNSVDAEHLHNLKRDASALLQAVVGPQVPLEPFIVASTNVYEGLLANKPFINLLADTQALLNEVASNTTLLEDPETHQRLNTLMDKLEFEVALLQNNTEFKVARAEAERIFAALKMDEVNMKVFEDFRKLIKDADGEFLTSLRAFLVPIIMEHLNSIPVQALQSRAKVMGSLTDFRVDNLKLNVNEFIPETFKFKAEYEMEGKGKGFTVDHQKLVVHVEMNNIQIHLKDIDWSYTRFSTPKMKDSGKASFDTGKKGISVKLVLEIFPGRTENIFVVKTAECDIAKYKVRFYNSKHNGMYKMLMTMGAGRIRKQVREGVEARMKELGRTLEMKMLAVAKESKVKIGENVDKLKQRVNTKKDVVTEGVVAEEVPTTHTTTYSTSTTTTTTPDATITTTTTTTEEVVGAEVIVAEPVTGELKKEMVEEVVKREETVISTKEPTAAAVAAN